MCGYNPGHGSGGVCVSIIQDMVVVCVCVCGYNPGHGSGGVCVWV